MSLGSLDILSDTDLNATVLVEHSLVLDQAVGEPTGHLLLSILVKTLGLAVFLLFLFLLVFVLLLVIVIVVVVIIVVIIAVVIVITVVIILAILLRSLSALKLKLEHVLTILGEGRHLVEHVLHDLAIGQGVVLHHTLLHFAVDVGHVGLEQLADLVLQLLELHQQLGEGGHHQNLGVQTHLGVVLLEGLQNGLRLHLLGLLLLRLHNVAGVLTEHVGSSADHRLVHVGRLQHLEQLASGVLLQVLLLGDDLHHTVPDIIRHVVSGVENEVHDDVHVPAVVRREALGQNSHLQGHLLLNHVIGGLQVLQELLHDTLGVLLVTHGEKHVQGTLTNGQIGILEGGHDHVLVSLDLVGHAGQLSQAGHVHETQVTDVRLLVLDEAAEVADHRATKLGVGLVSVGDDEVDGLEQLSVGGVVVVVVLGHLVTLEDHTQGLLQVVHVLLGAGVRAGLENTQTVHNQPGAGHVVVLVGITALLLQNQLAENTNGQMADLVNHLLLLDVGDHVGQQTRHGQSASNVSADIEQGHHLVHPSSSDGIRARTEQGQQGQSALLLDQLGGGVLGDQLEDILEQGFSKILTSKIGDGREGQNLVDLHSSNDIVSHGVDNQGEQLIGVLEENGSSEVTDLLLLEVGGGNESNDLHVTEVDFVTQKVPIHITSGNEPTYT